ncbi:hypothetical protein ACJMK2_030654 [Sinanodonta woodiana]|uniref:Uncharacterized protein n=1 Tax=Sinanodonta woodiana TaxID=1069815 RepID=A0ABD3WWD3_SINWO
MSENRVDDVKSSFNSSDQTMYVLAQKDGEWMVSGPFECPMDGFDSGIIEGVLEETIPNVSFNSNIDVQEEEINTFSHLIQNTLEGMCENVMDGIEDRENSRTDKLLKDHDNIDTSSKQESFKGIESANSQWCSSDNGSVHENIMVDMPYKEGTGKTELDSEVLIDMCGKENRQNMIEGTKDRGNCRQSRKCQRDSLEIKRRKWRRKEDCWQRNLAKFQRNSGQKYVTSEGINKSARLLKNGCGPKCRYRCHEKIPQEERENISYILVPR